jgi:PAS domain S-box-containing protein
VKALIVIVSAEGHIMMVNQWMCALTGYGKEELLGKEWTNHFVCDKERKEMKKLMAAMMQEEPIEGCVTKSYIKNRNGDIFLIEWKHSVLKDVQGKMLGILSAGEDISEKQLLREHMAQQQVRNRKEMMSAVLEAAEEERRQIAYELHDGVNQVLTVCKLLLDSEMAVNGESGNLKRVSTHIQGVINDMRTLAHRLTPTDFGQEGLYAALKKMISQLNIAGKGWIHLNVKGTKFLKALPPAIALSLFRIIQEAMNNIIKHAGADVVEITLLCSKWSADLEIKDNGRGFVRTEGGKGLGLTTIYSRAEAAGGMAYLLSEPGEGTLLSVHIPVQLRI